MGRQAKATCACVQGPLDDHHALRRLRFGGGPAVGWRQRWRSILSCTAVIHRPWTDARTAAGVAAAERRLPGGPGRPHGLWSPRLRRHAVRCTTAAAATVCSATAASVGPCTTLRVSSVFLHVHIAAFCPGCAAVHDEFDSLGLCGCINYAG